MDVPVGTAVVILDEQGNSSWVWRADGDAVGWIKTKRVRAPAPPSPSKPRHDGRPPLPPDTDSEPEAEDIQHDEPKEDTSGGDEPKEDASDGEQPRDRTEGVGDTTPSSGMAGTHARTHASTHAHIYARTRQRTQVLR